MARTKLSTRGTTTAGALLAAILENPDSDEPRLVYADFLQQRGDPRGELIATQIAQAALPATDRRRTALDRRATELLAKYKKAWATPPIGTYVFARGFPERWKVPAHEFAAHAAGVFAREPIRIVDLSQGNLLDPTPREAITAFARRELLRVRRLELRRLRIPVADAPRMFGAKPLANLRELDLGTMPLSRSAVEALARATFAKLERLELRSVKIDARFIEVLAGATFASALRVLDLAKSTVDDDAVVALAGAALPALATLDLGGCKRIRARGAQALCESTTLPALRTVGAELVAAPARRLLAARFPG